jgi:anti-sigma-K factor RskA
VELTHDHLKLLVAPYVLGALDPEEIPLVRKHILSCEECMAEADGFSREAAKLLATVDPQRLPEGFEQRILAEIAVDRHARAPLPPRRRRWSFAPGFAFLALVLVAGALSVGLLDARGDLARDERILAAVVARDGFDLTGNGAHAKMVPTDHGSALIVAGLDHPPQAHTYQLWLLRGEQAVSVSTFESSGPIAVVETSESIEGFDAAAVTIEPAGGSPQPTTQPILHSS